MLLKWARLKVCFRRISHKQSYSTVAIQMAPASPQIQVSMGVRWTCTIADAVSSSLDRNRRRQGSKSELVNVSLDFSTGKAISLTSMLRKRC